MGGRRVPLPLLPGGDGGHVQEEGRQTRVREDAGRVLRVWLVPQLAWPLFPFLHHKPSPTRTINTTDFRNRLCQDDGFNSFHCVDEDEDESDYLVGAYADLDLNLSLSVLGSGCIANGVGCVLNDNIWGLLCIVCDVAGVLCCLLDGLLGLC